jgi:hypothetical protein
LEQRRKKKVGSFVEGLKEPAQKFAAASEMPAILLVGWR